MFWLYREVKEKQERIDHLTELVVQYRKRATELQKRVQHRLVAELAGLRDKEISKEVFLAFLALYEEFPPSLGVNMCLLDELEQALIDREVAEDEDKKRERARKKLDKLKKKAGLL